MPEMKGKDLGEMEEEELRESERKFRTIFEKANDIIIYLDSHGKILDVNKRVEGITGYKPEEVIGKNFAKLGVLGIKDLPKMIKLLGNVIKSGNPVQLVELNLNHKNGNLVAVEVNTSVIKEEGKVEGFLTIIRDITKRKRARGELEKRTKELEKFQRLAVGRELKMVELKKRIKELENKLKVCGK